MLRTIKCFLSFGSYLDHTNECLLLTYDTNHYLSDEAAMEAASEDLWWRAKEDVEGSLGLHGFEPGDLEEDYDGDEEAYYEDSEEFICEQTELTIKPWDEEEHAPYCSYSDGLAVYEYRI